MNFTVVFILLLPFLVSSQVDTSNYLTRSWDVQDKLCGYVNSDGRTIIEKKYSYCDADTLKEFTIVYDPETDQGFVGIDGYEKILFEVYPFDNGPDYVVEGLFRIIENGLIGYANEQGEIVIKPKYQGAHPFNNGIAEVALKASEERSTPTDEHWYWVSDDWIQIDKKGKVISSH